MSEQAVPKRLENFFRRNRGKLWIGQAIVLVGIGMVLGRSVGDSTMRQDASAMNATADDQSSAVGAIEQEQPKIWTCSMHPQIRRDGPGTCPICGMDLVPVSKSSGGLRTISISPDVRDLMSVQTVPVQRRYVQADVRMVGKVAYDQTRLAHITAWVSGRLDRLYVDYEGVEVKQGDHMVYIYSEELYTAQQELIAALESNVEGTTSRFIEPINLVDTAREKLRLLGLTEEQIREIEQRRKPSDHVTLHAPVGGIVIAKLKQQGDRVRTGDRIYTVANLRQLWVMLDAYESDLAWLRYGQPVEFTTEAYPGEVFRGRVAFIDPVLNEATRTIKVRVNVSNEDGRLKPEMFVRALVHSNVASGGRVLDASLAGKWISPMHPEIVKDEPGTCDICGMPLVRAETLGYVTAEPKDADKPLVIPVSAALITGTRAIVYVQIPTAPEPTYEGREVVLGPRAGEYYLVRSGLTEGELVVTNGNFKLDSALQISAKPSMMTPEGGATASGHDHAHGSMTMGGESPRTATTRHTTPNTTPELASRLRDIVASAEALRTAIESADLHAIRQAFEQLGKRIESVDPSLATVQQKLLLQEFVMLIGNDSVEGREIKSIQQADKLSLLTIRHLERLEEAFGLADSSHQLPEASLEVPQEFRMELSRLLEPYLAISEALASDDVRNIAGPIDQLRQVITTIDSTSLMGAAAKRWLTELNSLFNIVQQLREASEITSLRSSFALLSDQLLSLQRTFGIHNSDQLFELHCPMAFEGRGATWIQSDRAVRNPYYGAKMLKCADHVTPLSSQAP